MQAILPLLFRLLSSSAGRWLLGGVVGLVLAAGGWLYVSHLQSEATLLRIQNADLKKAADILNRNNAALGDELDAAQARADYYQHLKEKVNASPSGSVPADIRAALDGLRDHKRP